MSGYISWVSNKITAASTYTYNSAVGFKKYVHDSVTAASSTVRASISSGFNYVFPSEYRVKAGNGIIALITSHAGEVTAVNLAEGWSGAVQVFNPVLNPAIFFKPKTSRVLLNAIYNNVAWYVLPVLLYEGLVYPVLRAIPGVKDGWVDWSVDNAAHLFFISRAIDTLMSSAMSFTSLSTALNDEVPPDMKFPKCKHVKDNPAVGVKADLMSTPYYWAKQATVAAISAVPAVGKYIAWPVRTLVYGEALVESKLAASQLCSEDRYGALARNHAYSFGMGLSLVGSTIAASWLINSMMAEYTFKGKGEQSRYVDEAVFNLAYMYFMVAAQLINKPLPGQQPPKAEAGKPVIKKTPNMRAGTDVFRIQRKVTDVVVEDIAETVAPYLSGPRGDLYERLKATLNDDALRFVRSIIFLGSLDSLDDFIQRNDALTLYKLHRRKIHDAIKEVRIVNQSGGVQFYRIARGMGLASYIVSTETANLLNNVILHRDLLNALDYLERRLGRIDQIARQHENSVFTIDDNRAAVPGVASTQSQQQVAPVSDSSSVVRMGGTASTSRSSLFAGVGPGAVSSSSQSAISQSPAPLPQAQSELTLGRPMRIGGSLRDNLAQARSETSLATPAPSMAVNTTPEGVLAIPETSPAAPAPTK